MPARRSLGEGGFCFTNSPSQLVQKTFDAQSRLLPHMRVYHGDLRFAWGIGYWLSPIGNSAKPHPPGRTSSTPPSTSPVATPQTAAALPLGANAGMIIIVLRLPPQREQSVRRIRIIGLEKRSGLPSCRFSTVDFKLSRLTPFLTPSKIVNNSGWTD